MLPAVRSSVSSHRKPYSGTYAAPGHAFGEHVEPLDAQAVKRIFRDSEVGGSGAAVDLVGAIASLDRERSLAGTLAALGRVRRIAERTGDRLDRLLAECTGAWLVSKERITKDQNREATTMTQVMTEYEGSWEEWGREKYAEGHAASLCRQAGRRFGADAGERLADLFGTPPDSQRLARAEAGVIECSTAEELLRRVRSSSGA